MEKTENIWSGMTVYISRLDSPFYGDIGVIDKIIPENHSLRGEYIGVKTSHGRVLSWWTPEDLVLLDSISDDPIIIPAPPEPPEGPDVVWLKESEHLPKE